MGGDGSKHECRRYNYFTASQNSSTCSVSVLELAINSKEFYHEHLNTTAQFGCEERLFQKLNKKYFLSLQLVKGKVQTANEAMQFYNCIQARTKNKYKPLSELVRVTILAAVYTLPTPITGGGGVKQAGRYTTRKSFNGTDVNNLLMRA